MAKSVTPVILDDSPTAAFTNRSCQPRAKFLLKGVSLALLVMVVAEALRIFIGYNFHCVVPGKCYRSGQPTAEFLANLQRTHGIRSILNLRDENTMEAWYQQEKQAAEELGITHVNAGLSGVHQPSEGAFRRFVRALATCQEPILIHCANGNDRTGFASAVYLMMHSKVPVAEARRQLALRYGHISWGKTSCLDRILNEYESWLARNGMEHDGVHFRRWAKDYYRREAL